MVRRDGDAKYQRVRRSGDLKVVTMTDKEVKHSGAEGRLDRR